MLDEIIMNTQLGFPERTQHGRDQGNGRFDTGRKRPQWGTHVLGGTGRKLCSYTPEYDGEWGCRGNAEVGSTVSHAEQAVRSCSFN